jgi:hypothetical protein
MPIVGHPFVEIGGIPKPALFVKLINPANGFEHTTWALIDTGADYTVIPEYIAQKLYHDVRNKKVKTTWCTGIGGNATAYHHTFSLRFFKSDAKGNISKKVAIRINKRLFAVVENLHTMVLGTGDFLKDYVLTIDYSKKVFSVRRP